MATIEARGKLAKGYGRRGGFRGRDVRDLMGRVRAGFRFSELADFQKESALPWESVARVVQIPERTLARRRGEGRLLPEESDRVLRLFRLFEMATELFEGDKEAARKWMGSAQPALSGETPWDYASTEVGAREVENVIVRLEHGVVG